MKQLDDFFDNMDRWRHLPDYQLERRADIFFSIYLPVLIGETFDVRVTGIIPEFPIRKGTINSSSDNRSVKADYLVIARDDKTGKNRAFLVELKTDDDSRDADQDSYLEHAQTPTFGLTKLVDGVIAIYGASRVKKYRHKYWHLLCRLRDIGLVVLDDPHTPRTGDIDCQLEVVYIQPHDPNDESKVISFQEVADKIDHQDDELGHLFATSLRNWAREPAGEAPTVPAYSSRIRRGRKKAD